MKKYLFLLFIIIPFLSGCEKIQELTKVDFPFSQSVTIPPIPIVGIPLTVSTPDMEANVDSILNAYNFETKNIDGVTLKNLKLTLSVPSDGDLSFIDDIEVYISASGLDKVKIASAENVGDVSTLDLKVVNANLKEYLLKDKFSLQFKAAADEPTVVEYKIKIDMTVTFDLKILGL